MIRLLGTSKQRIVAALTLSLTAHALLLWMTDIELPETTSNLPPLIAQLQTLPRASSATTIAPKGKTSETLTPENIATSPKILPTSDVIASDDLSTELAPLIASQVLADDAMPHDDVIAASSVAPHTVDSPVTRSVTETPSSAPPRPALPKHASLKFEVRMGDDGVVVGETRHTFDLIDGQYTLRSTTKTIGLARLVKSYMLTQSSVGTSDGQVLKPNRFSEEKLDDGTLKTSNVSFDREMNKLLFDSGKEVPLAENTQDMLSILYQFPPLPSSGDVLPISVTNGRKIEQFKFEFTTDEMLITPMGKLHTVHFRKLRKPNNEGLEIWFAQEYRLLPVKVRYIDPNGQIGGEALISEIRVSDN
ncbi:MAG: DUF3108 domain-containing protein [Sideroxydans sp.]|nr:DUF3108 domain-containing protein [Sideroxydans sp.]